MLSKKKVAIAKTVIGTNENLLALYPTKEAIESKIAGKEIVSADDGRPDNVIDLMEAMKKNIEMAQKGVS
jgi:non-homologous end joining protein Ku